MRNVRLWAYVALVLALAGAALITPRAWATPDQQGPGGTVPTVTPSDAGPQPTSIVPPPPEPKEPPEPTAPPPEPTQPPQPGAQPAPTASSALQPTAQVTGAAALQLQTLANPPAAWPGATVHFTTTLTNRGAIAADEIVLTLTLSQGLAGIAGPAGSTVQGQALTVQIPVLPPGGQFVLPFTATVDRGLKAGTVLQTVATASAAGGATAHLQTLLPMPPPELPRTGGEAAWPAWMSRLFDLASAVR